MHRDAVTCTELCEISMRSKLASQSAVGLTGWSHGISVQMRVMLKAPGG